MNVSELDLIFISYDEPNAEINFADLSNKAPWVKRVHGVKGSDAAHKAAANLSNTPWLITVDADNIVDSNFFNLDVDVSNSKIKVYSWLAENNVNGLLYGNGGLKIWHKDFILNMKTHEASDSDRAQVDFCWEDGYIQFKECYSKTIITGSPYQAWRAGFREGVKMTLVDGVKVPPQEIKQRVWWHNIHRLRMWSSIGMHVDNGKYAILGARMGTYFANCTDWDYRLVRDFSELEKIYNQNVDHSTIEKSIQDLGDEIQKELSFVWPWLDKTQSKFSVDLYHETINLSRTYYRNHV
jgi:hypothetical protein